MCMYDICDRDMLYDMGYMDIKKKKERKEYN